MKNESIIPDMENKPIDSQLKVKYTDQQIKDAEAFLESLKKIPEDDYEAGRLLVLGFMTALDRKHNKSS